MVGSTTEDPRGDNCRFLDVSRADMWRHIVDCIVRKRPETTELRWILTDVTDELI